MNKEEINKYYLKLIYNNLRLMINIPYYGDRPDEYAPWHAATMVAFYPGPFHPRYPRWAEHFVAYVRGANGVDELPH